MSFVFYCISVISEHHETFIGLKSQKWQSPYRTVMKMSMFIDVLLSQTSWSTAHRWILSRWRTARRNKQDMRRAAHRLHKLCSPADLCPSPDCQTARCPRCPPTSSWPQHNNARLSLSLHNKDLQLSDEQMIQWMEREREGVWCNGVP